MDGHGQKLFEPLEAAKRLRKIAGFSFWVTPNHDFLNSGVDFSHKKIEWCEDVTNRKRGSEKN